MIRRAIHYADSEVALTGVEYVPEGGTPPTAGILLVHGGAGLDTHAEQQARRYAELGYIVLAADMYGDGVAGDRARVMESLETLVEDRSLLVRRASAGLGQLSVRGIEAGRCAVVGFCFGGMVALALARAGVELAAAVSIHGSLSTRRPARAGATLPRILVCHGGRDPHVPMSQVHDFAAEMLEANADWQLVVYGRARHGFTHRDADPSTIPGVAYDEGADRHSFGATRDFLAETFAAPSSPVPGNA